MHLSLLAVSVCFGLHYFWGKKLLGALPQASWPLAWAAIRVAAAGIILGAVALAAGRWRVPARDLPKLAGLACLGVVFNQVFFVIGLRDTTPTQSALVNTSIPVVTLLLACLLRHEKLGWRKALGIALALAGVGTLLLPRAHAEGAAWQRGNALVFANAVSFSLFLALSRPLMKRTDAVAATAWLFAFGAVFTNLAMLPFWKGLPLRAVAPGIWGYGAAIILFATVVTYLLNSWALRRAPASTVAVYIYVQPLIAAVTSALWLGERLAWGVGAAAALIFGGVALGTLRPGSQKGEEEPAPVSD